MCALSEASGVGLGEGVMQSSGTMQGMREGFHAKDEEEKLQFLMTK